MAGGFPSQRASNAERVSMKWRFWLTLTKASKPELMTLCEGNHRWNAPHKGPTMWKPSSHHIIMHTRAHTHSHTPLWCVKVTLKLFGRMKIIWYYAPTFKSALTGRCPRDRPTNRPTARSPNRFDPGQALNELPKNWRVDISWPLSELNRFWSQSRMRQTLGWQLGNDWKK